MISNENGSDQHEDRNGQHEDELADIAGQVRDEFIEAFRPSSSRIRVKHWESSSGEDLYNNSPKEIPFRVDQVLPENAPMIVGAPYKTMKTGVILDLVYALATGGFVPGWTDPDSPPHSPPTIPDENYGGAFLDNFEVTEVPLRVGYLNGENGAEAAIARRFRAICDAHDGEVPCAFHADFGEPVDGSGYMRLAGGITFQLDSTIFPRWESESDRASLRAWIRDRKLQVVVFDPLYKSLEIAPTAQVGAMGALLHRIANLCLEEGCQPIFVHHFRQTGCSRGFPSLDDLSGAGFGEFARSWLLLNRVLSASV